MFDSRILALERETGIPAAYWQALKDDPKRKRSVTTPIPTNGVPIGIREASRKYDIPHQTLSRYADRGHVVVIETPTSKGLPRMLDEASVAHASAVYHADRGQGKNPFKTPAGVASRVAIAS